MSEHRKKIEEKVRNAVRQRKTDKASVVVRDARGHQIFELYTAPGTKVSVN